MTKKNLVIPILIGIGLFSVLLSLVIASQTETQTPDQRPLARISLNLGKVSVLRKNLTQKENLVHKSSLYPNDSVETSADGDATLDFDSAYRIRIMENSFVTIGQENDRTVLIVKRGDVQVENYGREGTVYVSKDGARWTATEYEMNYKRQAPVQSLPDLAPAEDIPLAATAKVDGLTPEFIQDTLRTQRSSFFKCYTQLLQRTPGVVGQASLSFTIMPTGKVANAEITSSSINDPNFKKCLVEAVSRVEFRAFPGDPIATVFPMKFE